MSLDFYQSGSVWKRRGHSDVQPGSTPDAVAPPTGLRKLQISRVQLTVPTAPPPPPPPGVPAYPGQPADGTYYIGWALGPNGNSTLTAAQGNAGWPAGRVSVIHNYAGSAAMNTSMLDEAINRGYLPSQSFKMAQTPAQIVAGSADATIDSMANACITRAPWPIWLCYYHEPEDNFTTATQWTDYRAAYRRIVQRFRDRGVTNVAWMPIFMNPYTFQASSGRDWKVYHADWTGSGWQSDIMMDLMGLDSYNPLPWDSATGGAWYTASRTNWAFDTMFETMRAKVELPGYPLWDYTIPEFGLSNAFDGGSTGTGPDWRPWATIARDYMKTHRVKGIYYWDNSGDTGRYSFDDSDGTGPIPHSDLNGTKIQGWNIITNAATVWTPPA